MSSLEKRERQLRAQREIAAGKRMSPAALSLAVNDIHNHALRLGHGVARCGESLECYRCGASCTVNDVDGQPVTVGTLHQKACR